MLTDRCAAVQVPQVVQFICQFDQFGLMAAMRRMCHLLTLPLLFRQTFVIRHLLNDTSHHRPEHGLQFCRRGVCVLYRVVKQSSLRGRYRDRRGMEREKKDGHMPKTVDVDITMMSTYLQNLDVYDVSFMTEDSCNSLKVKTHTHTHFKMTTQGKEKCLTFHTF